jgi:hypothetical protein
MNLRFYVTNESSRLSHLTARISFHKNHDRGMVVYSGLWSNALRNDEDDSSGKQQYPRDGGRRPPPHQQHLDEEEGCRYNYGSLANNNAAPRTFPAGSIPLPKRAHSFQGGEYQPQRDTLGGDRDISNSSGSSDRGGGFADDSTPSLTAAFRSFENRPILVNCLYYLAIYYLVAILAYSYIFEQWSVIDSLYFATNTL